MKKKKENPEWTFIYELIDPRDDETRYIGKSDDPEKRIDSHLYESNSGSTTYKNNWIYGLLIENLEPKINVIDKVLFVDWEYWEKWWIALYKSWGIKLTNLTPGGSGRQKGSKDSKTTKRRKRISRLGKKHSDKTREKIRLNNIKMWEKKKKEGYISPQKGKKLGKNIYTSKEIVVYDLEGNFIIEFYSVREASKELGLSEDGVSKCCRHKFKKIAKYVLRFKSEMGESFKEKQNFEFIYPPRKTTKGQKLTVKHKENISKALKGKKKKNQRKGYKHSESTRNKIREKALGRKWTEEQKLAIKGRPSPSKGKKIHKDGKPIYYFSLSGEILREFDSIKTASSETGISRWKIYASINNKVKEPYEFGYFKFKN
jgi:group I intron endonuclease